MPDTPDLSAPSVAKWLVTSFIAMKVTDVTSRTLDNHTRLNTDNIIVRLGTGLVGMVVSVHAKPYTDKMVDRTTIYIATKRVAYQDKKAKKKYNIKKA